MVVKDMKVVDYSTGSVYRYTDNTGSWKSIEAVDGQVGAGPQEGKGNQGNLAKVEKDNGDELREGDATGKNGLLITTSGASSTMTSEYLPCRWTT